MTCHLVHEQMSLGAELIKPTFLLQRFLALPINVKLHDLLHHFWTQMAIVLQVRVFAML